jgi:parafibromin
MIGRNKSSSKHPTATSSIPQSLPSHTKPARRPDPIILISPSASSLLRMSNIKSFLETGVYTPPDASLTSASASMLQVSRPMPWLDSRPVRFILVDSTAHFKPEYWARVVCVFTTGQPWQFKNYRWSAPHELFRHVMGVFVGWRNEPVPEQVTGWGRGVQMFQLEPWAGSAQGRWRDREVVEGVWRGVEQYMRGRGWSKGTGPTPI